MLPVESKNAREIVQLNAEINKGKENNKKGFPKYLLRKLIIIAIKNLYTNKPLKT